MTIHSSIAFVLALSLFVASPGPGMLGCVAQSMKNGLKSAAYYILGMICGDMVYLLFAVFGLAVMASVLGQFFYIVRVAGGIYLLYLGFKILMSKKESSSAETAKRKNSFITGFFITISNPKVIIMYCGFLPNFMDLSKLTTADIFIVAGLVSMVISVIMGTYAIVAHKTGKMITKRSGKALNKLAGAALIGVGSFLILKKA
ncbi:MAG: LysE family translocator [Deferribacterales bacterium]